jgi:hypothetical protein
MKRKENDEKERRIMKRKEAHLDHNSNVPHKVGQLIQH